MRLGLIGFGVIGQGLARGIAAGVVGEEIQLNAILVRGDRERDRKDVPEDCLLTTDPEAFFSRPLDVVFEVAGQEAARQYGERCLAAGADFLPSSVGALSDDVFRERLVAAARSHGRRVLIPSGAIGALDVIQGASVGRLDEVVHITRKHPRAWKGTAAEQMVDLDALTEPTVIFEGTPRESAGLFPANVNVQVAVALAGAGLDATRVQVVADPQVTKNIHEVRVSGEFGSLEFTLVNQPSPENPRTGLLTAFALLKTLRNLTSPLVIGV
ncbi:MAG: aspartate dehydrogenase [Thermaerobacterales bacterium]